MSYPLVYTRDDYFPGDLAIHKQQEMQCRTQLREAGFHAQSVMVLRDDALDTTLQRPGLDALQRLVRAQHVEAIGVTTTDILWHEEDRLNELLEMFSSHGVTLVLNDRCITPTPSQPHATTPGPTGPETPGITAPR